MGALFRTIWTVTVGWLLGLVWFGLSLTLMLSIVFFPIGAYMMSKTWKIMTFKRKPKTVLVEAKRQTA